MRFALFLGAALAVSAALAQSPSDVQRVLQRDFQPRGQAAMDHLVQDGVQRICTETRDKPPGDLARRLEDDQMKRIPFPAGSLVGDWKNGERIAQDAGGCYDCHQLSPQEASYGTLGPSLRRFGWMRGNGPEMQRYAYGKIYNAKAYNLCSLMPRLGAAGTLTPEQIKDLVGLLLDAESPVNQQ